MSRPRSIRRFGGTAIVLFLVFALIIGVWLRATQRADAANEVRDMVSRVVDDRTVAGLIQEERAIVATGGNAAAAQQITDVAVGNADLSSVGISLALARDAISDDPDTAIAQYNEIIASLLARSTEITLNHDLGSRSIVELARAGGTYGPLREALASEAAFATVGSAADHAAAIDATNAWIEAAQTRTPSSFGDSLQQIIGVDSLEQMRDLAVTAASGDTEATALLDQDSTAKIAGLGDLQRQVHEQLDAELATIETGRNRARLRNPAVVLGVALLLAAGAAGLMRRSHRPAWDLAEEAGPILDGRFSSMLDEIERGVAMDPTVSSVHTDSAELAPVAEALNVAQAAAVEHAVGRADARNHLLDTVATTGLKSERMLAEQRSLLAEFETRATGPDDVLFLNRMRGILAGLAKTNDHILILSESDGLPVPVVGASPVSAVLAAGQQSSRSPRRVKLTMGKDAAIPNELARDLTKVVRDLVDNALAYSPPHTTVTLQGDAMDGVYVVWITDEGIGLDAEVCAELNFELAHPRPVDDLGASGVGIAVVSRLAERHGLDVQLITEESTGVQARVGIPAEFVISVGDSIAVDVSPEDLVASAAEPDIEPGTENLTDDLLAEAGSGLANLANRARMAEAAASALSPSPATDVDAAVEADLSFDLERVAAPEPDLDLGLDIELGFVPEANDEHDGSEEPADLVDLEVLVMDQEADVAAGHDLFDRAPTSRSSAGASASRTAVEPVPTMVGADGEPEHHVELPLSARIAAAEARPSLASLADRLRK